MAGIGKVENVFGLLRVEHQCVLVRPVEHGKEVFAYLFLLIFHERSLPLQLAVILDEFGAEYAKGLFDVPFLQYCVHLYNCKKQHKSHECNSFCHCHYEFCLQRYKKVESSELIVGRIFYKNRPSFSFFNFFCFMICAFLRTFAQKERD